MATAHRTGIWYGRGRMKLAALMTSLGAAIVLAPIAEEPALASRYKLGTRHAAGLMRTALLRHPNLAFRAGYARRVKCNRRISDIRLKCKMSWIVGDSVFWGRGTIWLTFPEHRPFWNYSYRIKQLDEYCAIVEERDNCTRTYVVG